MGIKWFQLVDARGAVIVDLHAAPIEVPYVAVLRDAVHTKFASSHLDKIPPNDLVVYANRVEFVAKRAPLGSADSIASLGESLHDPLIVQTPPASSPATQRRWFQLVDVAGVAVAGLDSVSSENIMVTTLQEAAKVKHADSRLGGIAASNLTVYANRFDMEANHAPLGPADSIESLGESPTDPLIVKLPESSRVPPMAPLENAEELCNECAAVPTWQPGVVHSIQHLHAFMKPLGGCTQRGEVYWREEEKQIATLLGEWFPASGGDTFADKRIVLKGSLGVGKSTMFCLIAMYVAIVKKKNVLVVRKVAGVFYVFFVGHDSDQVVCFLKGKCKQQDAVNIYDMLEARRDFPSVCLMLDGFVYEVIPTGLNAFHLLATSQQVDLNSEDRAVTDSYLFPSWRPDDLFSLGESIYEWSEDVMNKRYYYSGGSVRDFTLKNADKIEIGMLTVVNRVEDPLPLLCCSGVVHSGTDQVECLRRTFVQRRQVGNPLAYLNPTYWDQAVDSAFAITALQKRKRVGDKDIISVYHWARANGSKSAALAGLLLELVFHHLAADNVLRLSTTPYHKLEFRQPDYPKSLQFTQLSMKKSGSIETDSTDDVLEKTLVDWKNDDKYSYWCPISQSLETVDSIVKLEDDRVAYLHMAVSDKRRVDVASLKSLNAILGQEKPMFIVVCQTIAAAKELAFTTRADVEEASDVCDVHVGFYGEAGIDPKMDDARNNVEADSHHCRHATHHGAVMSKQQSATRSQRTRSSQITAKRKRSEDGDPNGESDD